MSSTKKLERKIWELDHPKPKSQVRQMILLQDWGIKALKKFIAAPTLAKRIKFYDQLLLVNNANGLPTEPLAKLNAEIPYPEQPVPMPVLQEQSRKAMKKLMAAPSHSKMMKAHNKLRKINDELGIPTQTIEEIRNSLISTITGKGE